MRTQKFEILRMPEAIFAAGVGRIRFMFVFRCDPFVEAVLPDKVVAKVPLAELGGSVL